MMGVTEVDGSCLRREVRNVQVMCASTSTGSYTLHVCSKECERLQKIANDRKEDRCSMLHDSDSVDLSIPHHRFVTIDAFQHTPSRDSIPVVDNCPTTSNKSTSKQNILHPGNRVMIYISPSSVIPCRPQPNGPKR